MVSILQSMVFLSALANRASLHRSTTDGIANTGDDKDGHQEQPDTLPTIGMTSGDELELLVEIEAIKLVIKKRWQHLVASSRIGMGS